MLNCLVSDQVKHLLAAAMIFAAMTAGPLQAQTSSNPGASATEQAQVKRYAVDFWVEDCESKAKGSRHAALAYSKIGVQYCSTNKRLRAAEDLALKKCDKLVPRNMRKKAPCRIVSSGNEIGNQRLFDSLHQDIRMPVGLEIYDGDTKQLQKLNGFMVFGESRNIEDHILKIEFENGAPLCEGTYELKKRRVNFDMRCFGRFRFKDQKSKSLGYFLFNGIYAPVFSAKFTRNDSYIKVSPPDSE